MTNILGNRERPPFLWETWELTTLLGTQSEFSWEREGGHPSWERGVSIFSWERRVTSIFLGTEGGHLLGEQRERATFSWEDRANLTFLGNKLQERTNSRGNGGWSIFERRAANFLEHRANNILGNECGQFSWERRGGHFGNIERIGLGNGGRLNSSWET
ncbi:hypothetical protein AVEN_99307-1 [Araneus ventricosus]|uniref:Uncharacterized protein n=1 Tax=Araneus ventricosus TaxID=182803 RepID=A0A4Y2TF67_ARAVE|nr:hypothetical protein AVEN_99307-1 [Araneus ventricosus]